MIEGVLDAILVIVLIEAVGLVLWFRRTGRGIAPRDLLPNLAAGFFLMLACRSVLADKGLGPVAFCLLLALIAHLIDLVARWRA